MTDIFFSIAAIRDKCWPGITTGLLTEFYLKDEFIIYVDSKIGQYLGFTSDRFSSDSYLTKVGSYVMISLIISKGKGHFGELCKRILRAGLGIKIPTPMRDMVAIIKKQRYRHTVEQDPVIGLVNVWVMDVQRGHSFLIKNQESIVCLICQKESFNLNDIQELFCSDCGGFHNPEILFDSRSEEVDANA